MIRPCIDLMWKILFCFTTNGRISQKFFPVAPAGKEHRGKIILWISALLCSAFITTHAQDISDPNLKPVTLTGSLITSAENYSIPGIETQRPVNTARLFFNPTLTIYGVQLPFSFVLSTNERSYNQPFNQFGVSPHYKWLTLHAGYRSLQFSEFSLSDMTILGGGAEVHANWFHARGIYGRFRRSVEEDTLKNIQPVFKRMGWAADVRLGSEANFFGVSILRAWDDSTSLNTYPTKSSVYPEEDFVAELNTKISILKGKISFDGSVAGSIFTRDSRQPSIQNSEVTALSSGVVDTKVSSRFNIALKTAATYNAEVFSLRLEFVRVEPDYASMGATYIQNDRQDITVAPSLRLFTGLLRLGGSLGFRSDNLYDDRSYTTQRIISSANLNWSPSQAFGIDGQYSNYSMSNASASFSLNDTTRVENVTESYSVAPRVLLLSASMQNFFMLFLTRQKYADRNILTGSLSNNDVLTGVLNYTGTFLTGWGFSASLQYTQVNTAFITNIIRGLTFGANKFFFNNTLNTNISYTLNLTKASSESETDSQHLVTLSAQYRLSPADAFELRSQYNIYKAVNAARASYSGTTSRIQYSRTFSFGMR